jgi:hypothetical protein
LTCGSSRDVHGFYLQRAASRLSAQHYLEVPF